MSVKGIAVGGGCLLYDVCGLLYDVCGAVYAQVQAARVVSRSDFLGAREDERVQ